MMASRASLHQLVDSVCDRIDRLDSLISVADPKSYRGAAFLEADFGEVEEKLEEIDTEVFAVLSTIERDLLESI